MVDNKRMRIATSATLAAALSTVPLSAQAFTAIARAAPSHSLRAALRKQHKQQNFNAGIEFSNINTPGMQAQVIAQQQKDASVVYYMGATAANRYYAVGISDNSGGVKGFSAYFDEGNVVRTVPFGSQVHNGDAILLSVFSTGKAFEMVAADTSNIEKGMPGARVTVTVPAYGATRLTDAQRRAGLFISVKYSGLKFPALNMAEFGLLSPSGFSGPFVIPSSVPFDSKFIAAYTARGSGRGSLYVGSAGENVSARLSVSGRSRDITLGSKSLSVGGVSFAMTGAYLNESNGKYELTLQAARGKGGNIEYTSAVVSEGSKTRMSIPGGTVEVLVTGVVPPKF